MAKMTLRELNEDIKAKFFKGTEIDMEATIDGVFKARLIESKPGASEQWAFWSQFVILKDRNESIGYGYTTKEEAKLLDNNDKGKRVRIEGAVGDTYINKNKELTKKLTKGRLSLLVDEGESGKQKESFKKDTPTTVEENPYERNQIRILRQAVLKTMVPARIELIIFWKLKTKKIWTKEFENECELAAFWANKEMVIAEKSALNPSKDIIDETVELDRNKAQTEIVALYGECKKVGYFDKEDEMSKWLVSGWEVSKATDLTDDQVVEAKEELLEALGKD